MIAELIDLTPPPGYRMKVGRAPSGRVRYHIVTPDGDEIGGAPTKVRALQSADRHAREARAVRRPCLCCGAPFMSEGAHNRLCDPCRGGDAVAL